MDKQTILQMINLIKLTKNRIDQKQDKNFFELFIF